MLCTCRPMQWWKRWDSNPRDPTRPAGFKDRCVQPLRHASFRVGRFGAAACFLGERAAAPAICPRPRWRSVKPAGAPRSSHGGLHLSTRKAYFQHISAYIQFFSGHCVSECLAWGALAKEIDMARVRSPNYPAVGLPEAVERVRKLYESQHQTPEEREVVARHLGYGGLNGKSLKLLSALIKYGLLEKADDSGLRVTDLAINILFPENDDRSQSIRAAAFAPDLFSDIRERWPDHPPTDESLRAYLVRRQFSQSAIDDVIQNYRDTIELVTRESSEYGPSATPLEDREMPASQTATPVPSSHEPPFRAGFDGNALEGSFRLTTPEHIDTLVKFLQVNRVMIAPVYRAGDTEYSDDDEGRAAQQRDQEQKEQMRKDD